MKAAPPGWPRISSALFYDDAKAAIDFLCRAFGFEAALVVEGENGRIEHSELRFPGPEAALIMVGSTGASAHRPHPLPMVSPRRVDGQNTQCLAVFVDDVDTHAARARAAGARIAEEPKTSDYGEDHWADRSYRAIDPEGHQWWFLQRVRGPGA